MRIQPLHQPQKARSESAKEVRSERGGSGGIGKTKGLTRLKQAIPIPQDWQEHGTDPHRDQVSISDDAKKWQQGDWLTEGLKQGENPKATAQEVVKHPEFAQQAKNLHKPRVQLREMAKKGPDSREDLAEENDNVLPGPFAAKVDPKIAMASRHAPLESMFHKGPKTLNIRGNLSLPGGQNLPLTASFEMNEAQTLQAAFGALAG